MTPDRPPGADPPPADARPRREETPATYRLCVFACERFPASTLAVRERLFRPEPADGDVAVARLERALRALPESVLGPWAARPERLHRGIRLHLAADGAGVAVAEIEHLARRLGLAVFDEELEEIGYPCALDARGEIEEACRAVCAAEAGYLVIEGGPGDRYFVQSIADVGCPDLRLEAAGNRTLGEKWRIPRSRVAELDRRGWRRPRGAELNHSLMLPRKGLGTPPRLAGLLRDALEIGFGLPASARVTICFSPA